MAANPDSSGTSPAGAEPKTCPVCGASFGCLAAQQNCWCEDVKLSAEKAADLRAQFSGCLCPRCLALAAERGGQSGENSSGNPAS